MSYIAEIRITSFGFAPRNWALCNGQFLPINQNQPLFAILGTSYGGNGQTTFALPDFRGRAPLHTGGALGLVAGQRGGEESHTLSLSEIPQHIHSVHGSSQPASLASPLGNLWAAMGLDAYSSAQPDTALSASSIGNSGGSQPHENRQPYLVLSFIICLSGTFPSSN